MSSGSRCARVSRDDGQPLGTGIFLTALQLRALGLEPETVDKIEYTVEDGEIRLTKPDPEVLVE